MKVFTKIKVQGHECVRGEGVFIAYRVVNILMKATSENREHEIAYLQTYEHSRQQQQQHQGERENTERVPINTHLVMANGVIQIQSSWKISQKKVGQPKQKKRKNPRPHPLMHPWMHGFETFEALEINF